MRRTAVIVHWGPPGPTVELSGWLAARPAFTEVVVVANDLRARPPGLAARVEWLVPPRNLGFGAGVDLAWRLHRGAACYLLLHNDVRLDDAAVATCLDLLALDRVGVVGPTLVNAGGVQSGGGTHTRMLAAPRVGGSAAGSVSARADWVAGAVMFVRGDCYEQVRMDGRYFLGFEDADFCHRARVADWDVRLAAATAWHTGGGSIPAGRYVYYAVRNRLWFVRALGPPQQILVVAPWGLVVALRLLLVDLVRRRGRVTSRLAFHGLLDGVGRRPNGTEPRADEPRAARWASWG